MKTPQQLRALVERAGGTLEEDFGPSGLRIFQAVARPGYVWAGSDLTCLMVQWARGSSALTLAWNEREFDDLRERVSHGQRPMTAAEIEERVED